MPLRAFDHVFLMVFVVAFGCLVTLLIVALALFMLMPCRLGIDGIFGRRSTALVGVPD